MQTANKDENLKYPPAALNFLRTILSVVIEQSWSTLHAPHVQMHTKQGGEIKWMNCRCNKTTKDESQKTET